MRCSAGPACCRRGSRRSRGGAVANLTSDCGAHASGHRPFCKCVQKIANASSPRPNGELLCLLLSVTTDREACFPRRACRLWQRGDVTYERRAGPGVLGDPSHAHHPGGISNVRPLQFVHRREPGQKPVAVFFGSKQGGGATPGLVGKVLDVRRASPFEPNRPAVEVVVLVSPDIRFVLQASLRFVICRRTVCRDTRPYRRCAPSSLARFRSKVPNGR